MCLLSVQEEHHTAGTLGQQEQKTEDRLDPSVVSLEASGDGSP